MTEDEWLAATDLGLMLEFVYLRTSGRKLRLFACACCRSIWHLMSDEKARRVVNVVERLADGKATVYEARFAWIACKAQGEGSRTARELGAAASRTPFVGKVAYAAQSTAGLGGLDPGAVSHGQSVLFRDICGNPFRPVALNPSRLTTNVRDLALAVYDERQFPSGLFDNHRLAILADALEEAGCDNVDILGHLRGGGEHVRGCWAVDLILGKE